MDTPICDFVRSYASQQPLRLHMPGHKGIAFLGMEDMDITEIDGADSLYEASGIIARSEANASTLFGCRTLYSTEGSSQCIRAMLYLALLQGKRTGKRPLVAAGRNAHKTFLTAAALLDLEVDWLYPRENAGYLSCDLTPEALEAYLNQKPEKPIAVYLTSPDYLGNTADIQALSTVCHRHGVLLVVDNAHGAYLKFLPRSRHPVDLGADLCCDSAHKTLPVLTGGAYLHISRDFPEVLAAQAKNSLALFGSTSPSYLILQSLDMANVYLDTYSRRLTRFLPLVDDLKSTLTRRGYTLYGNEPLKLTISAKSYGYLGTELGALLAAQNILPEFADPDYLVLMLTPETGEAGIARLEAALLAIPAKPPISQTAPRFAPGEKALSIREALLSLTETVRAEESLGRILAVPTVGCPPAVPIVICGERISAHHLEALEYYGIEECCVVHNS